MATILVTGGTGFLGANLCRRLVAEGHRVLCVDDNSTGRMENVRELAARPEFRFVHQDIYKPLGCRLYTSPSPPDVP